MKFEKISDDKLKVTLSPECLKQYQIEISDMEPESAEYQYLLRDVLEFASDEMGGEGLGKKIVVDGCADSDGNWIITITKVAKFRPGDRPPRPIPTVSDDGIDELIDMLSSLTDEEYSTLMAHDYDYKYLDHAVFCFNNIENLLEAISHAPGIRNATSKLYLLKDKYYLEIKSNEKNEAAVNEFCAICSEFNGTECNAPMIIPSLLEYGKPLIKKAAISTLLKKFEV